VSKSNTDQLAEARAKVIELEAAVVVDDPAGQYPYRRDDAIAAGIPADIADAAERVVQADEARRKDPSETNEQAYNEAVFAARRLASERRPVPDTHEEDGVDADGFRVLRRKRDGALTVTEVNTGPADTSIQDGE
jgi:hypothetical protein